MVVVGRKVGEEGEVGKVDRRVVEARESEPMWAELGEERSVPSRMRSSAMRKSQKSAFVFVWGRRLGVKRESRN